MRKIIFGLFLTLAGVSTAAGVDVSSTAKYCKFEKYPNKETEDAFEARLRSKCQVGDIIMLGQPDLVPRFCDFSKPVVVAHWNGLVCYLAPKREVY